MKRNLFVLLLMLCLVGCNENLVPDEQSGNASKSDQDTTATDPGKKEATVLDSIVKYSKDGECVWKKERLPESTADRIVEINYKWSNSSNCWLIDNIDGKEEYIYDYSGKLTSYFRYQMINDQWIEYEKTEYTYYSTKSLRSIRTYWWTNGGQWKLINKSDYYYDENELLSEEEFSYLDGNNEWNTYKYKRENTKNGLDVTSIVYYWRDDLSKWVYNSKHEIKYDSDNNITYDLEYRWSSSDSDWVYDSRHEYTFIQGNMTSESVYTWYNYGSEWVGNNKTEYNYDDKGKQLEDVYYTWSSGHWFTNGKAVYYYSVPK